MENILGKTKAKNATPVRLRNFENTSNSTNAFKSHYLLHIVYFFYNKIIILSNFI